MSNENNQTIFKAKCQREFDETLPHTYALIKDQTGEDCDTEIILRFADLGRMGGAYNQYLKKGWNFQFCPNVTLNAQLIDHPDETQPTIAHELAHFVVDQIKQHKGITDRRGKWGAHGTEWKKIARSLGDDDSRCHQMRLETSKFKVRMSVSRNDEVHHEWLMSTKGIEKWAIQPNVIKVEVKNTEGFWIPFNHNRELADYIEGVPNEHI